MKRIQEKRHTSAVMGLAALGLHAMCYFFARRIFPQVPLIVDALGIVLICFLVVSAIGFEIFIWQQKWPLTIRIAAAMLIVVLVTALYMIPYAVSYPNSRLYLPGFDIWLFFFGLVLVGVAGAIALRSIQSMSRSR